MVATARHSGELLRQFAQAAGVRWLKRWRNGRLRRTILHQT